MRYWRPLAIPGAALLVTGCASTGTGVGTATPRSSVITLRNADSGKTVRLSLGGVLQVVLTGGYWTFKGSSAPSVLKQDGTPTRFVPSPSNCPPGLGCTPLAARFTAIAPGTAQVQAGRTSCGEARRCTGDEGRFSVTVVVAR